jgi:hypothetical protein
MRHELVRPIAEPVGLSRIFGEQREQPLGERYDIRGHRIDDCILELDAVGSERGESEARRHPTF